MRTKKWRKMKLFENLGDDAEKSDEDKRGKNRADNIR